MCQAYAEVILANVDTSAPAFRIGELARRTGVAVPTLRSWEIRYRLLRPARTAGGQRLYSLEDQQRVMAMRHLVSRGVAVGPAARSVASHQVGYATVVQPDIPTPESAEPAVPIPSRPSSAVPALDGLAAPSLFTSAPTGRATAVATEIGPPRLSVRPEDTDLLALVHMSTRSALHAETPREVVDVLRAFVERVGGTVVAACATGDPFGDDVIPVDLSFGEGPPLLPRAELMSVGRLCLEQVLPELVEDARRIIALLRSQRPAD